MTLILSIPIIIHITKDIVSPVILIVDISPPCKISSNRLPIIIGMLIKNEYFAVSFLHPIILDVAIVVPLLLMPGITAIP